MGPIASTPSSDLPRRRWAVLAALPLTLAIARGAIHQPTVQEVRLDHRLRTGMHQVATLDAIARAHRDWVADHGPGCARSLGHLEPYTGVVKPDLYGRPLHFECERRDMGRTIIVDVVSIGADGELGTSDDVTGMDIQTIE